VTPSPTPIPEYGSGIIGGYVEGLSLFGTGGGVLVGGREVVYNFTTFERSGFTYTGAGVAPSAGSVGGQIYVGHVEKFIRSANSAPFQDFFSQYSGESVFSSGELNLKLPVLGGGAVGILHSHSPLTASNGIYGNLIYVGGTVGGLNVPFGSASTGSVYYSPEPGSQESYIENCQVNTSKLTSHIRDGVGSPHLQGPFSSVVSGYRWGVILAENIAAWSYNASHQRCG